MLSSSVRNDIQNSDYYFLKLFVRTNLNVFQNFIYYLLVIVTVIELFFSIEGIVCKNVSITVYYFVDRG